MVNMRSMPGIKSLGSHNVRSLITSFQVESFVSFQADLYSRACRHCITVMAILPQTLSIYTVFVLQPEVKV